MCDIPSAEIQTQELSSRGVYVHRILRIQGTAHGICICSSYPNSVQEALEGHVVMGNRDLV